PEHSASPSLYLVQQAATDGPELTATSGPRLLAKPICPPCGWKSTLNWQEAFISRLPRVGFAGINFTMPSDFWAIFRRNRELLADLSAIGGQVVVTWAEQRYGAQVMVMVVLQTFGDDLKFYPHLHIIVSTTGFDSTRESVVENIRFFKDRLMRAWRYAVLDYLELVLESGRLKKSDRASVARLVREHRDQLWVAWVNYYRDPERALKYNSRYIRRPPLPEYKIVDYDGGQVTFRVKDTKLKCFRNETKSIKDFIAILASHAPDRYRHGIRYFGLLAPRSIADSFAVFCKLIRYQRPATPRPPSWARSIWRTYRRDPLASRRGGQRLYWWDRLAPRAPSSP
ncbi:MAG: transposase, partial [Terracidiphilus sp.]